MNMKTLVKWTVVSAAVAVVGTIVYRAIQEGRANIKQALGRAEQIADRTRVALTETEAALHETREAI
jgi:hypothetical protein